MLSRVARPSAFTKLLTADPAVPTPEASESAPTELIRRARKSEGSFTWVAPEKREAFELKWVSPQALADLGLPEDIVKDPEFTEILAGAKVLTDYEQQIYPWAQNYAGYQFGQWAGQLGDGRATSLFGVSGQELQLKGAGMTPYSRFADGKAVLRSSIREALVSEYLHKLRIPTQRCLALVSLPKTLARRERIEKCAVITRFIPSWVRFGSFDLHHARGDRAELRRLADYCISELGLSEGDKGNRYYKLFRAASLRNARMIARCQAYGFLNGVLNTDNISVLGMSIDYGPFAFMDTFDSSYTPNHDDYMRRYGFKSSPMIMWWNCVKLGESLGELIGAGDGVDDPEFVAKGVTEDTIEAARKLATDLIMRTGDDFQETYETTYKQIMLERLGLFESDEGDADVKLIEKLLTTMEECEIDYSTFFRRLSRTPGRLPEASTYLPADRERKAMLSDANASSMVDSWLNEYQERLSRDATPLNERKKRMEEINPNFLLRNSVLSNAIELAEMDQWDAFDAVAAMALDPYAESWDGVPSLYSKRYLEPVSRIERDSQLSCSS